MSSDGWVLNYSMRIDLAQVSPDGNSYFHTLAFEAREGEPPVKLPVRAYGGLPLTITTTVHRTRPDEATRKKLREIHRIQVAEFKRQRTAFAGSIGSVRRSEPRPKGADGRAANSGSPSD